MMIGRTNNELWLKLMVNNEVSNWNNRQTNKEGGHPPGIRDGGLDSKLKSTGSSSVYCIERVRKGAVRFDVLNVIHSREFLLRSERVGVSDGREDFFGERSSFGGLLKHLRLESRNELVHKRSGKGDAWDCQKGQGVNKKKSRARKDISTLIVETTRAKRQFRTRATTMQQQGSVYIN